MDIVCPDVGPKRPRCFSRRKPSSGEMFLLHVVVELLLVRVVSRWLEAFVVDSRASLALLRRDDIRPTWEVPPSYLVVQFNFSLPPTDAAGWGSGCRVATNRNCVHLPLPGSGVGASNGWSHYIRINCNKRKILVAVSILGHYHQRLFQFMVWWSEHDIDLFGPLIWMCLMSYNEASPLSHISTSSKWLAAI